MTLWHTRVLYRMSIYISITQTAGTVLDICACLKETKFKKANIWKIQIFNINYKLVLMFLFAVSKCNIEWICEQNSFE